ncbi:MAG: hypothetical protein NT120_04180 [Candidatus Aenigmarchaeota archaeon]|nr:hypothetical protein [Candidatus Aenigmarchaeota archaeon]
MKFGPREIFTIAGSLISYILFVFLIAVSNISVNSLVNLQNSLLKSAILQTNGLDTLAALSIVIEPFKAIFLGLLLLSLYFSFLTAYGFHSSNKSIGLIVGAVCAIITIVAFHSILSLFVAVALLLTGTYVVPLANTYAKEMKKWVRFRVGSNATAKALLIFNVLLAVGVFVAILSNAQFYTVSFKAELTSNLEEITMASLPDIPVGNVQGIPVTDTRKEIGKKIAESLANSPMFNAYLRWLPVLSAIGVWFLLEILRNLVLSNVSGVLSYVFTKFHEKRMK